MQGFDVAMKERKYQKSCEVKYTLFINVNSELLRV